MVLTNQAQLRSRRVALGHVIVTCAQQAVWSWSVQPTRSVTYVAYGWFIAAIFPEARQVSG
ncbi:hypothetical protein BH686_02360 [Rhodococcus erythropolis]|nr:hypothetical protein B0E55_06039 [Rhodococcus sp. 66b]ORI30798.1 hypothetical protein BH686_02360 [Rhodococcus erythropolis]